MYATRESKRFTEKKLDSKRTTIKAIRTISKGVRRSRTAPSLIILTPKNSMSTSVMPPIIICFGRVKGSVVKFVTIRGKVRKAIPSKTSPILSIYSLISFLTASINKY